MTPTPVGRLDQVLEKYFEDNTKHLPVVNAMFEDFMALSCFYRLPRTGRRILDEVRRIAENDPVAEQWPDTIKAFLVRCGAEHYRNARYGTDQPWVKLLANPRYAESARYALSALPEQQPLVMPEPATASI